MDGKGHRFLAPIFTAGTSLVLMKSGMYNIEGNFVTNLCLATALSVISASWADADQLTIMPKPIATGTAKKIKSKKYNREFYYIKVSEKEFQVRLKKNKDLKYEKTTMGKYLIYYDSVRHPTPDMLLFMNVFKIMGLKIHRGWQSHSVILWTIVWTLLCWLPTLTKLPQVIISPLQVVLMGLGLGYLSHLVADKFTKAGLNEFTDNLSPMLQKIPLVGNLLSKTTKKFKFNFAKANNRKYAYFVGVMMIIFFWAILDFNSLKTVVSFIISIIMKLLKELFTLVGKIIKGS